MVNNIDMSLCMCIYIICLVLAGNPQYYLYQNLSCGICRHFPMSLLTHLDNKANKSDR